MLEGFFPLSRFPNFFDTESIHNRKTARYRQGHKTGQETLS